MIKSLIPSVFYPDDGSILIEWINVNWRLGISVEKPFFESSWYFVSKNGKNHHGYLFGKRLS